MELEETPSPGSIKNNVKCIEWCCLIGFHDFFFTIVFQRKSGVSRREVLKEKLAKRKTLLLKKRADLKMCKSLRTKSV